jgi:hypothetical protein
LTICALRWSARTGRSEILARAANLLIGCIASETARQLYENEGIDFSVTAPGSSPAVIPRQGPEPGGPAGTSRLRTNDPWQVKAKQSDKTLRSVLAVGAA